jgi:transglutaminase-like putative cysteine protease
MTQITKAGKKSPRVRALALKLVKDKAPQDFKGEIIALFLYVRDVLRYVKDIRGVETLHTPDQLLNFGQGDCDDKSILLASLLESIGHPTRFIAAAYRGGRFSHVYLETRIGRKWLPLETCVKDQAPFTVPENPTKVMINHN